MLTHGEAICRERPKIIDQRTIIYNAGMLEARVRIELTILVRYYRNEGTAAQVLAAAAVPDPAKSNGQMCEAHFYIAQRELQNGNIPAARKLFELALQGCPKSYSAWLGSNLEIRDRRPR